MSVVSMTEVGQATVEIIDNQEIARTQSPTIKNYALELPTFGAIVGVSQTEAQWNTISCLTAFFRTHCGTLKFRSADT